MSTMDLDEVEYAKSFTSYWWIWLITGTFWLVVSLIMFRFNIKSVNTIGILAGVVFIVAGLMEILVTIAVRSTGWKVVNAIFALLLIVGGIFSFIHPSDAFDAIASITGFMFLFAGIVELFVALANRDHDLWWLRLILGILYIALAFWASGDFQRKQILLIVAVGIFALFRGISHYFLAFAMKSANKELQAM